MTKKVIVLAEIRDNTLRNVSFEAIGAAHQVAAGGEIVVAIFGENVQTIGVQLFAYGATRVIAVEHPHLKYYTSDGYHQALQAVLEQENPDVLIFGHTALGKDFSPKVASKLKVGLISDVTKIEGEGDAAIFVRPIYSGKAFEKVVCESTPLFFTVRPNNITPLSKNEAATGTVETITVNLTSLRTIVKNVVRKSAEGVDLSEAKIIVSGGRGVKSAEGFQPLQELANLLGGAVGASRGACDAEYCDYSLQIGQTGKVVTPDLYIACGISGAIQHLAGMSNSKIIVAINKDPEANIFKVADYGIVGDLFEVVPLLIEEVKQLQTDA